MRVLLFELRQLRLRGNLPRNRMSAEKPEKPEPPRSERVASQGRMSRGLDLVLVEMEALGVKRSVAPYEHLGSECVLEILEIRIRLES